MPAESAHQRPAAKTAATLAPPPEPERLPCPRCDSTNTKFCYYNNYNFSQPRHFCKSCRRYWTRGGTLRDIPVGGATRKNAKRSRILSPPPTPATTTTTNSTASSTSPATLPSLPVAPFFSSVPALAGSFTSMLNGSAAGSGGLFGLGLGIGPGYDDVGLGPLGRAVWAFPEVGYIGGGGGGGTAGNSGGGLNAWQLEDGGDHIVAGDCFSSWPELAISTPGSGLK